MDFFGIGVGIEGAARVYCISARQSGRTISLINSLKTGDRVVFHNIDEAKRVKNLCKARHIKIDYIIVPTGKPYRIFDKGPSQGRTILDHSWVENFYLERIASLKYDIQTFQVKASGGDEANEETKQKAIEITKWKCEF